MSTAILHRGSTGCLQRELNQLTRSTFVPEGLSVGDWPRRARRIAKAAAQKLLVELEKPASIRRSRCTRTGVLSFVLGDASVSNTAESTHIQRVEQAVTANGRESGLTMAIRTMYRLAMKRAPAFLTNGTTYATFAMRAKQHSPRYCREPTRAGRV